MLPESIWVFSSKCIWKRRSISLTIILLLKFQCMLDLSLQGLVQAFTQHCFSILVALTVSNCNGVVRETDVLNSQAQALGNTEPTACQRRLNTDPFWA